MFWLTRVVLTLGLILGLAAAPASAADPEPQDEGQTLIDLDSANTSRARALALYEGRQFVTAAELAGLAATHFENLAQIKPDEYGPAQMECLILEATCLRKSGELDLAYRAGLKAAEKLKAQVKRNQGLYLPFQAEVNQELAETAYELDRENRARQVLGHRQAAVEAYTTLARTAPAEYGPLLHDELATLILDCREFGFEAERQKAIDDLLAVSRRAAEQRQEEKPALARDLVFYGEEIFLMGRTEPGLAAMREGTEIYRELERRHPGHYFKALQEAEFILESHR